MSEFAEIDTKHLLSRACVKDKECQLEAINGAVKLSEQDRPAAISVLGRVILNYAGEEVLKKAMFAGVKIGGTEATGMFGVFQKHVDENIATISLVGLINLAQKYARRGNWSRMESNLNTMGDTMTRALWEGVRDGIYEVYYFYKALGLLNKVKALGPDNEETSRKISEFLAAVEELRGQGGGMSENPAFTKRENKMVEYVLKMAQELEPVAKGEKKWPLPFKVEPQKKVSRGERKAMI